MTSVTIFGTGNMGTAIGEMLADGGASVQHITRSDDATIRGNIVVFAVPYEALDDIVQHYGDQLEGRIVVDITNPVDFDTFDSLEVPVGSSAAAELQTALPNATVI
jgi:predicted dinucleotide-binding enzyme